MYLKDARKGHMGVEVQRQKPKARTSSLPRLPHSLATAPAGRTLAPHFSIFSGMVLHPKGPLGAETSGSDEICGKITGQVNSLAPLQTLFLFSQHSLAGGGCRLRLKRGSQWAKPQLAPC